MRKGTIVYDLVLELEKRIMTYREIQIFMSNHPSQENPNPNPKRGHCSCNIVALVNADTIKRIPKVGYYSPIGTHLKKSAYGGRFETSHPYSMKESKHSLNHPEAAKYFEDVAEKFI